MNTIPQEDKISHANLHAQHPELQTSTIFKTYIGTTDAQLPSLAFRAGHRGDLDFLDPSMQTPFDLKVIEH